MNPVDDVVQAGGEVVDVLAVKRGDEGRVELLDDLVGDHVRLVLDLLDGVHPRAGLGEVVHLFMQKGGGLDDMRRLLLEVVEKADLPGDQVEHTGSNEV